MNELIFEEWKRQGLLDDLTLEDSLILFFIKYLDKHSLRLHAYASNIFTFSNEAQVINFSSVEITKIVNDMKRGISFPWEKYD